MNKDKKSKMGYGLTVEPSNVIEFIKHCLETNKKAELKGKPKTPTCIWGLHGIGKTDVVKKIAAETGSKFIYIAPAQFEEMGDLLGMPDIEVVNDKKQTIFQAPSWVPTEEGPGILLIDDVNRADDRILRGIMQLLQNYELASWKLPKGWDIILTANPENSGYSVTDMDDAMLTRMRHITMQFNINDWIEWAVYNNIDDRGITFVQSNPEIINDGGVTPRSLVQFFETIVDIPDFSTSKNKNMVKMLGSSSLPDMVVNNFIEFVNEKYSKLPSTRDILFNYEKVEKQLKKLYYDTEDGSFKRVDIINIISTRIALLIQEIAKDYKNAIDNKCDNNYLDEIWNDNTTKNLNSFIGDVDIPDDIKFIIIKVCSRYLSYFSNVEDNHLRNVIQANKNLFNLSNGNSK
jgi:hypothetical protein